MASKYFFLSLLFIITWACLIDTTLGAAGSCYQCDSRNPGCQISLDAVIMANNRVPCNGQCYIRVKDGLLSRGCSWEYGFMTRQLAWTQIYDQGATWVFCDTPLCNWDANIIG